MRFTVCVITGIAAVVMMIACIALIATGAMMQPGQPAVLGVVSVGMLSGVLGSALGAISLMTYQTPFERSHWRGMDNISQSALPRANAVAAHSPSDGLK